MMTKQLKWTLPTLRQPPFPSNPSKCPFPLLILPYSADLAQLVQTYDYFLFDCDGVLWAGGHQIHDAFKALKYLQSHGKHIFLITNNSTRLRETIVEEKLATYDF